MVLLVLQYRHTSQPKTARIVALFFEKSLSTRTHKCPNCGTVLDRDHNAAINILVKGLMMIATFLKNTEGHLEINAQGEDRHWRGCTETLVFARELVMQELGMGVPPESRAISRRD